MRHILLIYVFVFEMLAANPANGQITAITFNDLVLPNAQGLPYENGSNLNGTPDGYTDPNDLNAGNNVSSFTSGGAVFSNAYNPNYGWTGGFVYSNVTNTITVNYTNQYAAFNTSGIGPGATNPATGNTPAAVNNPPATYAVVNAYNANYNTGFYPTLASTAQQIAPYNSLATIQIPSGMKPTSISVTNTTYAALIIQNGDPYHIARPQGFAPGDSLQLTINGYNANQVLTGTTTFYLANYPTTNGATLSVIQNWTKIDLSGFGPGTTELAFGLAGTDSGDFGLNDPGYFALSELDLVPVPEPMTATLLAAGGLGFWRFVRRKRALV